MSVCTEQFRHPPVGESCITVIIYDQTWLIFFYIQQQRYGNPDVRVLYCKVENLVCVSEIRSPNISVFVVFWDYFWYHTIFIELIRSRAKEMRKYSGLGLLAGRVTVSHKLLIYGTEEVSLC